MKRYAPATPRTSPAAKRLRYGGSVVGRMVAAAGPSIGRLAAAAGPVLAYGAHRALRKSDKGDPDIITTQHDTTLRYMKGRMTRRKKRRIRFQKRVRNAVYSDVGLRSFVSDDGGAIKTIGVNAQGIDGALLGGIQQPQNDELLKAFQVAFETPAGTISSFRNRKVFIKSMVLDIHMVNSGTTTVELDVYQVVMRRDWPANQRMDQMYIDSYNEQPAAAGYSRTLTTPGVTPFQNSNFCEHFKILSKRTIQLGAGQVTSLQLRIGRPRAFEGKVLERYTAGIPGYTKGYLFVYKGAPRNNAGVVERAAGELTWTQERTMTVARSADGQNADIAVTV